MSRISSCRRLRRAQLAGALAVAAAVVAPASGAARTHGHHEFAGTCQVQGTETTTDPVTGAFRFAGDGACSGLLDGLPVSHAAMEIAETGTATLLGPVPLTGGGQGVVWVRDQRTDRRARFPFTARQVGTVVHGSCRGGGDAIAFLTPSGPPSAGSNDLTGVLQTLTPCRG